MEPPAHKRFLRIEGFKGQRTIFKSLMELAHLTENHIKGLLRALAAKPTGVSYDQIVRQYAERRIESLAQPMPVEQSAPSFAHGYGDNPTFTARVVDAEDKPIQPQVC